jgi:glucose/arabinose dehydrogenase
MTHRASSLRRPISRGTAVLGIAVMASCARSEPASTVLDPGPVTIPEGFALRLEQVVGGLGSPVALSAPAGDNRIFVVLQSGVIRILRDEQLLPEPFLDIRTRVRAGGEQGLLGIAFHPQYAQNGWFFLNYTLDDGSTRVERYSVSGSNPDVADPGSAAVVLTIGQPFGNHNGGMLLFTSDSRLLIGMGDGGSGGDPQGHGQNRGTLLGSLLRIDVDALPYSIPSDNPFRNMEGLRPEIWAYGLRNPWRFAVDRETNLLYIADVGQNQLEEIDVVPLAGAGVNYGWNTMEGNACYSAASCDTEGLVLPLVVYNHSDGCSITGGFVYRGQAIPEIRGHYFYSDYCQGWLRSFRYSNGAAVEHREWDVPGVGQVLSFGEDAAGELYVLSQSGTVYRIVKSD